MFGIGMPEMFLILAIALIVIGPKKLPDLAKSLGRAIGEFKKTTTEFKETIKIDNELEDVKQTFGDINENIKDTINAEIVSKNKTQNFTKIADRKQNKQNNKRSLKDE